MKLKNYTVFLMSLLLCLSVCAALSACTDKKPAGSESDSVTEVETDTPPAELADGDDLLYYTVGEGEAYAVAGLNLSQGAKKIVIPDTFRDAPVVAICEEAFMLQKHLESLVMPDSVKHIGSSAFSGCENLKTLTLSPNVEFVGEYAFEGCDKLELNEYQNALYLGNDNEPYTLLLTATDNEIDSCTVHKDTKIIYDYAFAGCTEVDSIMIPNGIKQIGIGAFEDCLDLEYTRFDELDYLGNETNPYLICAKATNRKNAEIYNVHTDTKIIAPEAFVDCSNLRSVVIPNGLAAIGAYAFEECPKLASIELDRISSWSILDPDKLYPLTNMSNDSADFFDMLTGTNAHCMYVRQD